MRKEIPMMFSEPMVIALGNDTKTETRRTRGLDEINKHPDKYILSYFGVDPLSATGEFIAVFHKKRKPGQITTANFKKPIVVKFPYGKKGDVIWVRETFGTGRASKINWYKADHPDGLINGNPTKNFFDKWKPSIHMPREAARTFLYITEIGIEPLHNITLEAAINEGIEVFKGDVSQKIDEITPTLSVPSRWYKGYGDDEICVYWNPISSYKSLWESINGAGSWDNNPFVWVLRFRKLPYYGQKTTDSWVEAAGSIDEDTDEDLL